MAAATLARTLGVPLLLALCLTWWRSRGRRTSTGAFLFRCDRRPAGRERLSQPRNELFDWFRASTPVDATFVATKDVLFYLQTGRQGARPIALTTDALYEGGSEALDRQLPHIPDTANAIGASYWVWTAEDYSMEPAKTRGALVAETDRLLTGREVVFESSDARIRVYRWNGR